MTTDGIVDFYENKEKENLIFSFKGEVTSDKVAELVEKTELALKEFVEKKPVIKKVCNVAIECLQNLYHHNLESDKNNVETYQEYRAKAIFMVTLKDGFYEVHTGNFMSTKKVETLKEKLEIVNRIEQEDIRHYHRNQLNNVIQSKKGTAGLGFLDIRRKSGNKLGYAFHEFSKEYTFFCLHSKIKTK